MTPKAREGLFIVFEGIDGSGKSTQIQRLAKRMRKNSIRVHKTFEPTDGPIGLLIRDMLKGVVETDQRTIATLFAADRTDHLMNSRRGVLHRVQRGEVVLSDRYYFSSYAYHSQYIDMEWVIHVNTLNADILRPDLNIFIDVAPEACFNRLKKNRKNFELYETIEVMKRVRDLYFKSFAKLKHKEYIEVIDGNATADHVEERIWRKVADFLNR